MKLVTNSPLFGVLADRVYYVEGTQHVWPDHSNWGVTQRN